MIEVEILADILNHNMVQLDPSYYLQAMNMYRQKFKKENKRKKLIFVFVSDDIQWGKDKLLYQHQVVMLEDIFLHHDFIMNYFFSRSRLLMQ